MPELDDTIEVEVHDDIKMDTFRSVYFRWTKRQQGLTGVRLTHSDRIVVCPPWIAQYGTVIAMKMVS